MIGTMIVQKQNTAMIVRPMIAAVLDDDAIFHLQKELCLSQSFGYHPYRVVPPTDDHDT
jgi:hypothetical protein